MVHMIDVPDLNRRRLGRSRIHGNDFSPKRRTLKHRQSGQRDRRQRHDFCQFIRHNIRSGSHCNLIFLFTNPAGKENRMRKMRDKAAQISKITGIFRIVSSAAPFIQNRRLHEGMIAASQCHKGAGGIHTDRFLFRKNIGGIFPCSQRGALCVPLDLFFQLVDDFRRFVRCKGIGMDQRTSFAFVSLCIFSVTPSSAVSGVEMRADGCASLCQKRNFACHRPARTDTCCYRNRIAHKRI